MMTRRLTPVAVLLAAVLAMGATNVANGAETVRLALPLPDYQGIGGAEFAVVTGVVHGTTTGSYSWSVAAGFGGEHPVVKAILVSPGNFGTSGLKPVTDLLVLQTPLRPGSRLVNFVAVDGGWDHHLGGTVLVFEATIVNPWNLDVALVTTPAGVTLAEDHKAVVGADTDELGIADAVCVKKGEKSVKTEIISDIPLESGDRLTDFLELDFNPDTGETLYGAWLEY